MKKMICFLLGTMVIAYSCDPNQEKKDDSKELAKYNLQLPEYPMEALNATADSIVKNWPEFMELQHAMMAIGETSYQKKTRVKRTNFISWSEDFINSSWVKNSITIEKDVMLSPEKTLTADAIKPLAETQEHYISYNYNVIRPERLTFSIYVKKAELDLIYINNTGNVTQQEDLTIINLGTEEIIFNAKDTQANVEKLEDNWYRISQSFNGKTRGKVTLGLLPSQNQIIFEGQQQTAIYIWGAQLENTEMAKKYIATSGKQESIDEVIDYVPREDEKFINSSYQRLYYQVDDIDQRIQDLYTRNTKPKTFDVPLIISRIRNLETEVLLLEDALKNDSYISNEKVNTMLKAVYHSYNQVVDQMNRMVSNTLNKNMKALINQS